jgi:hypothetical protein
MTTPSRETTQRLLDSAERASLLWIALQREGLALLICDTLDRRDRARAGVQPEFLMITRLRQSGMATLSGTMPDLRLTMLGLTATAPSVRGVLRDWATEAMRQGRLG